MKIDLIENGFVFCFFVGVIIVYSMLFTVIGWQISPGFMFVIPFLAIAMDMDSSATKYRTFLISHGISKKGYLNAKLMRNITISLICSVAIAFMMSDLYRVSTAVCVAIMFFFIASALSAVFSAVQFLEKDATPKTVLLFVSLIVSGILMLFSALISISATGEAIAGTIVTVSISMVLMMISFKKLIPKAMRTDI